MKKLMLSLSAALCGWLGVVSVGSAQLTWTGAVSNDWLEPGNWSGAANGGYYINTLSGKPYPVLTGMASIDNLRLGQATDNTGSLTINSGTLFVKTLLSTGNNGGSSSGTITLTGAGYLAVTDTDSRLYVGNNGRGTLNLSDTAQVISSGTTIIGNAGSGTVSISGSAYLNASGVFSAGGLGNGNGRATVTLSNSGSLNVSGSFVLGHAGSGTLNVMDTASVTTGTLFMGLSNSGAVGVINLTGGVVQAAALTVGTGTGILNASGGTLRAGGDSANFLNKVNVSLQTGGLVFDTNGHAVGLTNALNGLGGLTKTGAGTLTLSGGGGYTGVTAVQAGTLLINSTLDSGGDVSLSGGTLAVGDGLALNFGALELAGAAAIDLGAGATLTFSDSSGETWSGALSLSPDAAQMISFTNSGGLTQTQWELIAITGYLVTGLDNSGHLLLQAIPEPSTWLLLSVSAALLLPLARRRKA